MSSFEELQKIARRFRVDNEDEIINNTILYFKRNVPHIDESIIYHAIIKGVELSSNNPNTLCYPHIMTAFCRLQLYVKMNLRNRFKNINLTSDINKFKIIAKLIQSSLQLEYPQTAKLLDLYPEIYLESAKSMFSINSTPITLIR